MEAHVGDGFRSTVGSQATGTRGLGRRSHLTASVSLGGAGWSWVRTGSCEDQTNGQSQRKT